MRRPHPGQQMSMPISLAIYQQLLVASNRTCFEKEDWEIAAEAIDEWMRRHDPDAILMPATRGYQWKSLFLPDGTLLRTVFGGKNHHCLVENDQILYNGGPVSPSGFVNQVGGIRRNAWRCTWILLPDAKDWKLADTLRVRERPQRGHRPAGTLRQAPAPAPASASAPAPAPDPAPAPAPAPAPDPAPASASPPAPAPTPASAPAPAQRCAQCAASLASGPSSPRPSGATPGSSPSRISEQPAAANTVQKPHLQPAGEIMLAHRAVKNLSSKRSMAACKFDAWILKWTAPD